MRITLAVRARAMLCERLVFGDANQIWALGILEMLAELEQLYRELPEQRVPCDSCNGKGEKRCGECGHQSDCEECAGCGKVIVEYDEDEWTDSAHLAKHLGKIREQVGAVAA